MGKRLNKLSRALGMEIFERASETGSPNSPGTAGVPGRSEIKTSADGTTGWSDAEEAARESSEALGRLDHRRDVALRTPEIGWNTFQGVATRISYASKRPLGDEFTLTVYFDSRTGSRLAEALCGIPGFEGTGDVPCFRMTVTLEPPTT